MSREAELKELEELKELRELRARRAAKKHGMSLSDIADAINETGQFVGRGIINVANLPAELLSIPLNAIGVKTDLGAGALRQGAADIGFAPPVDKPAEGFLQRGAEIFGGSIIPAAGVQKAGAEVLKRGIPAAQRTVTQNLTALTAQNPAKAATLDVASSLGAGVGGEVASNLTDDPNLILLGEIAGGFSFPAVTAVSRFAGQRTVEAGKSAVIPFTRAGAEPRAARRLKSLSADPQGEAARIDPTSPVSPARQTGNPRLIALEKAVLEQRPELEAKFTKDLNDALASARQQSANFGGTDRTREVLESGQEHLVNLVNLRAAKAAQTAQARIDEISTPTPRQVSQIAREELDTALKDVRAQESELWKAVGKDVPAEFNNSAKELSSIRSETSKRVPLEIPQWMQKAIMSSKSATLNDVQQVRSRVLGEARQASKDGDFDKARIMNRLADGLLADLEAVEAPGVAAARGFSRSLNERFSQGAVKDILSRGARKGAGIASEDTLKKVFSGGTPATNAKEFLAASPESAPQLQQFLRSRVVSNATRQGTFNPRAAQAEINKLQTEGLFDVFPNLRGELDEVVNLFNRSQNLSTRAGAVAERGGSRLSKQDERSLAKLLLGGDPGEEMAILLRDDNAVQLARSLKRRMGGNKDAVQGLKSSFVETLFNTASRDADVSGELLAKTLKDNLDVARALGMNDTEISRIRSVANRIIQAQTPPGKAISKIMTDKPAAIMDFLATLIGAKVGQRIAGGGLGSSLKVAAEGSKQAKGILQKLTTDSAEKLLVDAMSDPVLFKALMTKSTAPPEQMAKVSQIIESWLIGAAATQEQ